MNEDRGGVDVQALAAVSFGIKDFKMVGFQGLDSIRPIGRFIRIERWWSALESVESQTSRNHKNDRENCPSLCLR